jgi:hypothetical protein
MGPSGSLGLAGFLVAFVGTTLFTGALWFELFITPPLAVESTELAEAELGLAGFVLSFLLLLVGWILFGVATLRARVYPRWSAWLLIGGVVVALFPIPLAGLVFSAALIWLGYELLRR